VGSGFDNSQAAVDPHLGRVIEMTTWIRLTNPMTRGPGVRRWQELLHTAGYDVDVDGAFGPDTDAKTRKAQADLGVAVDGIVGEKSIEAMQQKLEGDVDPAKAPMDNIELYDDIEVWDYRGKIAMPKNAKPDKGNRWPKLSGVVLHRTACRLGEKPERYFKVNAHMHVTLEGRIILCHPWDLHIWHGHRPSLWTLGIEYDGNPEGYPGYHWSPGGGPDPITDAQVKASDVLLNLLLKEFAENGREFKYIYAHRQASENRECDPGWEAWQKIAVPWMEKTGAVPGDVGFRGTTFGTGFCIPKSWDSRSPVKGFRVQ